MIPKTQQFNGIDELEETIENIKLHNYKTLIILDDIVSDLKDNETEIEKLFFNRRHIGGGVSLILTSQVYNKISAKIRKCATTVFISIWKSCVPVLNYKEFTTIVKYCFKKNNHEFLAIDVQNNEFYHNFNHITFTATDI